MIKEAMEFILKQSKKAEFHTKYEEVYTDVPLNKIEEPTRRALETKSLSSVVEFIKDNFDGDVKVLVNVVDEQQVLVQTELNDNMVREVVLNVEAEIPDKTLNSYMDLEEFNIQLQSQFVPTEDSAKVLQIIGNLRSENVKNLGDDGITQMVEVRKGVTMAQDEAVPNPVHLKPFRSFTEIAQPESPFVFRLKQRSDDVVYGALFEADGGAWKNAARQSIKEYLNKELKAEVKAGSVLVIG